MMSRSLRIKSLHTFVNQKSSFRGSLLKRVRNIILYLPESFEWLVLRSGLVRDSEITKILAEPSENIESEKYFSWERFFTALLTDKTKDTYLHYQKSELNSVYIRTAEQEAVLSVMPKWLP